MTKRYCTAGHDTFVFGRVQRMCRECRRIGDRARYLRRQGKQIAYWHQVGYLKRINRMVDGALHRMEALFGRW